jgi:hypothetical protein
MKKIKLFEEFNGEESIRESFYRLPSDVIGSDLYLVSKNLMNFYDSAKAGNDVDPGVLDSIIKKLNEIKKSAKKFNKAEEVTGTAYESIVKSIVTEAAVKELESSYKEMTKHIKSGYGWIDPDYVQETWENLSDIDFESIKTELYKRLIKDGLLWFAADSGEQKGKQVKSLKEVGVKESLINEAFEVTVSVRHAKDAIALFNDMFIKYGKRPSTDVFSFKEKDAAIDFVQMLVKNLQIPMGEIKADDAVIKNLK